MLVVVCPGQGAQSPGMLAPWLELGGLSSRLAGYSDATGQDLAAHGTTSDADTIRDTAVAQPLLVATALLTFHAVFGDADGLPAGLAGVGPGHVGAVGGHSVGELGAAAIAGVLTEAQALDLVSVRGAAMARAAAARPTGMSALLGGDPAEVLARLAELGLTAANVNGGGQVVAAGSLSALAALTAAPPARTRVIPLQVAGAFHTTFMQAAVAELAARAATITPADARIALVMNADGAVVTSGSDALARLVAQVANPVRWDLCQQRMQALGVTGLLELAPAGVLTGLARRSLPGVETVAVKTPGDLDAARDLVRRHAGAPDVLTELPGSTVRTSPEPQEIPS